MKQAQITVFIIIGILILVAFAITVYTASKLNTTRGVVSQQRTEHIGVQSITDYVTTCLTISTIEALKLLGKQGGHLYESQNGITPDPDDAEIGVTHITYADLDYGTVKVPYLIEPPQGQVGNIFFATTPEYPYPAFPYATPGEFLFQGYYGLGKLPPLYKVSPENETVPGSIQETLEKYIAARVVECADFSKFKTKGYSFAAAEPQATFILPERQEQFVGEQQANIQLSWPIEITGASGKSMIDLFAAKIPMRLATAYYFVKGLIDSDVTDISFIPASTSAFEITTLPQIWGDDSLVIVKDKESALKTKPFEFWVARKNRPAALWQIDEEQINTVHVALDSQGTPVTIQQINETSAQLRIEDPCDDPTLITIHATDPDENLVTFTVRMPAGTNKIPVDAKDSQSYEITIFAEDGSRHPDKEWHDHQQIPLTVIPCEID